MATLAAIPSPGKFPKSLNTKSVTPPSFSWAAGVHYRETCLSPRKGGDVPKSLNPNLTPIPKGKCPLPSLMTLSLYNLTFNPVSFAVLFCYYLERSVDMVACVDFVCFLKLIANALFSTHLSSVLPTLPYLLERIK